MGLVSRALPVQTAARICMRDGGRSFWFGDLDADPKPPRAAVVKSHGGERCGNAETMISAGMVERDERKQTGAEVVSVRGKAVLAALDEIAAETKATPAQVALAWLLSRTAVAAPIAGATTVPQLEDIMGAARLVLLPEAIARLTAASSI